MAISKLILNGEVQMDVTSDTVAAGSLLSGKTATKNDGTKVTGTIASKSSSDLTVSGATVTAPAGYYANAASKAVATTTHPNPSASITSSTGVVTASHTQSTGYVTSGTTTGTLNLTTQAGKTVTPTESAQTAVASYRWTTGNVNVAAISSTYVGTGVTTRSAANLTASGSVVTVPAGYYSTAATKAVAAGSAFPPAVTITKAPTIGVNTSGVVTASYNGSSSITPTVTSGYISQGTAGTISTTGTSTYQLTSKAAATYYPSTADQTIASQRWLVGNQTIKSVTTSNLTAANIAEGVVVKVGDSSNASRITQVTGTYSPDLTPIVIYPNVSGQTFTINEPINITTFYCGGTNITNDMIVNGYIRIPITWGTLPSNGDTITINGLECNIIEFNWSWTDYETFDGQTAIFQGFPIQIRGKEGNFYISIYSDYIQIDRQIIDDIDEYSSNISEININITTTASGYGPITVISGVTIDNFVEKNISGYINTNASYIASNIFEACNIYGIICSQATEVGRSAFYECRDLNYFNGPRVEQIRMYAFYQCMSLSSINIPNVFNIGENAFYYCTSLQEVNLPLCNALESYAFAGCGLLQEVNCPNVTYLGNQAFSMCRSLSNISFPLLTSLGQGAFAYCSALSTISLPSVIQILSSTFTYCNNLNVVRLPMVQNINSYAFNACYNLLSLYLNGASVVTLTNINAFASTPISNYTTSTGGVYGKIYVPASLYNSYKTATNWATFSSRFVSI